MWSNVEKTFGVAGTDPGILQVSASFWLRKPGVVGQLDHAEAQVAWAE